MKLTFLGTRGYIDICSERHKRHTATLIEYKGRRAMIDCGEDWLDDFRDLKPQAIMITHCHPDHAWGLKKGAPCPVWASAETWQVIGNYPIEDKRIARPGEPVDIEGLTFTMFPVQHSTRCPAGGYRVSAGVVDIFYVPDLVFIHDRTAALSGCRAYVGDGATITRSMVRKPSGELIGHTPLRTQLTWCQKEGVPLAVFTHLGSEIVRMGDDKTMEKIAPLAEERGVEVRLAHDGLEMVLR